MALTEKMIKCVCGDRYKRELSNFCGNVYEEYLVINGKRVKNEIPFHIFVKEEGKQRFDRWIEKEYNRRLEESLRRQILTEEDYIERIIYATGVYHTWYVIDTEKERDEWDANIRQRALHLYSLGFKPKGFCIDRKSVV